jgi:MerR family transcriptional regulator/heat shock protein HspR
VEIVCEQLQIPRAQLHRYERLGLIAPSGTSEDEPATPRYTEDDLRRLRRIRRLQRDLGLDLAGLQVAVRLLDQISELQRRLEERTS